MFVCPIQTDVRCGDRVMPAGITRLLAWGEQQLDWLKFSAAPEVGSLRVGHPGLDRLRRAGGPLTMPPAGRGNVLVLPFMPTGSNSRTPRAQILTFLVETVRMLQDLGYRDIVLKLHPGVGGLSYVERVASEFRLSCKVVKSGRMIDLLDWAHIVIGPVESGAMVETLALGRPYFGVTVPPSSVDDRFFPGFAVHRSVSDLRRALLAGDQPDRERLMNYLCSFADIDNSARRIWRTLAAEVGGAR
jgi:hypothetical protein